MSEDNRPEAFLQYKNTDACIDLYCTCGEQFHFDGYFANELTCGHCGQTWELPHMLRIQAVEPTRQLKLIFDEDWAEGGVIQGGEFAVPWPRAAFSGADPGDTFEICDEVDGCHRSAYVKLVRAEQAEGGTMRLIVRNTGPVP